MRSVSELVFYTTIGCMAAQVLREVDYQKEKTSTACALPVEKPAMPLGEEETKNQ